MISFAIIVPPKTYPLADVNLGEFYACGCILSIEISQFHWGINPSIILSLQLVAVEN
jgi:hypothetical protein